MRRKWVLFVAPPVFLLFIAIGGFVVRELWNWLLPPLFGLPSVTFWQALGVLALSRILFGGCGWRGSSRSSRTPEERERFRQAFRKRFGFGPPASDTSAQ
jgi:membrane protein implicated in regulation of membrane protease activity